jgi:hypothetical protein
VTVEKKIKKSTENRINRKMIDGRKLDVVVVDAGVTQSRSMLRNPTSTKTNSFHGIIRL